MATDLSLTQNKYTTVGSPNKGVYDALTQAKTGPVSGGAQNTFSGLIGNPNDIINTLFPKTDLGAVNNPAANPVGPNAATQGLLQDIGAKAGNPAETIPVENRSYVSGAAMAGQSILNGAQMGGPMQGLGGVSPSLTEALNRRQNTSMSQDIGNLNRQLQAEQPMREAQAAQRNFTQQQRQSDITKQYVSRIFEQQNQDYQNIRMQEQIQDQYDNETRQRAITEAQNRQTAISAIFGIAGNVAGQAMGGKK